MSKKIFVKITAFALCALLVVGAVGIFGNGSTVSNAAGSDPVTMLEFASFLMDKKEHYPLSDEFIERYQQTSGGYLDTAKKAGITVDKTLHSPNQKWHFFDSWLMASIQDGSITWDADAKKRVYSGLLCPELLLWIFEACGVDPVKVRAAKQVAEQGKSAGTKTNTIAANMRAKVSWEDLMVNFNKDKQMAVDVSLPSTLEIEMDGEDGLLTATVQPVNTTDTPIWTVTDGADCISIVPNGKSAVVHATKVGTATVNVSYNKYFSANCTVTVAEPSLPKIIGVPAVADAAVGGTVTLDPSLSKGSGTFTYLSSDVSVAMVSDAGVITAMGDGSATVTVTCVEDTSLTAQIAVEVFDHGTTDTPLTVSQALSLAEKVCLSDSDSTATAFVVAGIVSQVIKTGFILSDTEKQLAVINDDTVGQNDVVVLSGLLSLLEGVLCVNSDVQIIDVQHSTSTVTLGQHDNAAVLVGNQEFSEQTVTNGTDFTFTVQADEDFVIVNVTVNGEIIAESEGAYTFTVRGNSQIAVTTKPCANQILCYNVVYDLGTGKTAQQFKEDQNQDILAALSPDGDGESIILSVSQYEYIYGGGNGGSGENRWYSGDMLKFGTTSVNGSLTLQLTTAVVGVRITGYVAGTSCKIKAGDSQSTDWTEDANDNKTTTVSVSEGLASKDVIESGTTAVYEILFERATSITIATTNKKPLLITSIEFILADSE